VASGEAYLHGQGAWTTDEQDEPDAVHWVSDLDYARTGKVFIKTWGYGRYSLHLQAGKLERWRWKMARSTEIPFGPTAWPVRLLSLLQKTDHFPVIWRLPSFPVHVTSIYVT
jgi:hypothetical protein